MANGFKALHHVGGGTQRYTEYPITAASAAAMYSGDAVQIDATLGTLEIAVGDIATGIGIFVGCRYVASDGRQVFSPYWPADTGATEAYAMVSEDQGMSYKVKAAAATQAAVGDKVAVVNNDGENAALGLSTQTVTVGATNGPFIMRSLLPAEGSDVMIEVVPVLSLSRGASA